MTEQKIIPNIWCNRNAEEVGAFYANVFENAEFEVESRYPSDEDLLLDFQKEFAGAPLAVTVTISGYRFLLINAGDEFSPNPSISFMLNFDPLLFDGDEDLARASLDRLWERLREDGSELMSLGEYPFRPRYGWVQDRFGVSWQLMLTDPAGDPRPFILPSLMFSGSVQNRAREAVDHYLDVFADVAGGAERGIYAPYPEPQGPATPGAAMFSDFRIGSQWFAAMDSGVEETFPFSCGVSLEVTCEDQREIDRYWDALSAVPEAEQCGWLVDRFGVSWQIVPRNMDELMQKPGAYSKMMSMKKLVIDEF